MNIVIIIHIPTFSILCTILLCLTTVTPEVILSHFNFSVQHEILQKNLGISSNVTTDLRNEDVPG